MRKLLVALALLGTVGCDDSTVHEYIIDNFVCVYMPWWMGDCQSEEVVSKVDSFLDHGLVEAQISCHINAPHIPYGDNQPFQISYTASKLLDGSCLVNERIVQFGTTYGFTQGPGITTGQTFQSVIVERGDTHAASCEALLPWDPAPGEPTLYPYDPEQDGLSVKAVEGNIVGQLSDSLFGASSPYSPLCWNGSSYSAACTNPEPWFSVSVESVCTGFNLAAFGVEE